MQAKLITKKEKIKFIIILTLTLLACLLTYYFHGILISGSIFTHFFYLPIILAAFWWKRKGIFVAIFLAIILIMSHILFGIEVATISDYLRAVMFLAISIIVIILSERISEGERRCNFAYTQLNQIFNSAGHGMRVIDKAFNVLETNNTFSALSGEKKGNIIGKKCFEVLSNSLCQTSNCTLTRILNGDKHIQCDIEGKLKNGKKIPCILTATPFNGPDGQLLGIIENFQDITERKANEEALQRSEKQLQFLSSQLLTAQENERKRIACELHDGIGQILNAVKYGIKNLLNQFQNDSTNPGKEPIDIKSIEATYSLLQNGIEDIRNICMNLRPSILDDIGILATISWFCREFQTIYSDIHINEKIDIEEVEIPEDIKTVIYRILQEAFNNITKHSKATQVLLVLKKKNGIIDLLVEDNGIGFDLKETIPGSKLKGGIGLASMKERAKLSGGQLSINHSKKGGIALRATWPSVIKKNRQSL